MSAAWPHKVLASSPESDIVAITSPTRSGLRPRLRSNSGKKGMNAATSTPVRAGGSTPGSPTWRKPAAKREWITPTS